MSKGLLTGKQRIKIAELINSGKEWLYSAHHMCIDGVTFNINKDTGGLSDVTVEETSDQPFDISAKGLDKLLLAQALKVHAELGAELHDIGVAQDDTKPLPK